MTPEQQAAKYGGEPWDYHPSNPGRELDAAPEPGETHSPSGQGWGELLLLAGLVAAFAVVLALLVV